MGAWHQDGLADWLSVVMWLWLVDGVPCGGGIEYLHRSPVSHKRWQKGNPVPGVYLGHPVPGGYKYGDLALQVGGVSRIGIILYGLESYGTQARAGLRWQGPAATVLLSERALQNKKPAKFQGERKFSRGSQKGALHQDRLADWLSVVN
jgi:hypothetical protein